MFRHRFNEEPRLDHRVMRALLHLALSSAVVTISCGSSTTPGGDQPGVDAGQTGGGASGAGASGAGGGNGAFGNTGGGHADGGAGGSGGSSAAQGGGTGGGGQGGSGAVGSAGGGGVTPYPNCWSQSEKKRYFPCDPTKACVPDCSACPGKTLNCVESSECPTQAGSADRSCVASCTECTVGGVLVKNDVCNGYCVNLLDDTCNCGTCNTGCFGDPWTSAVCSAGHCCPGLKSGGITEWVPACNQCCTNQQACGSQSCTPEI